jgi:hypothetical protein
MGPNEEIGYLSALFKKSMLKLYVAIDKFVIPPYTTCMKTFSDITGRTFGRLTVMARVANNKDNKAVFLCRCSCGKEIEVLGVSLKSGNTASCGCLHRVRKSANFDSAVSATGKELVYEKKSTCNTSP